MGAVVLAALALPGVWSQAHAETAPEEGVIGLKFLHYQDSQPGLQRVRVDAPSIYVLAPLSPRWSLEGAGVIDVVSGATPRWHSSVSSASVMHERRLAGDIKITHYGERSSLALGISRSTEHDYHSNAASFDASRSSEDNNTTLNFGLGLSRDSINPANHLVTTQRKQTQQLLLGVTQAWSAQDLLQFNLSLSHGTGYYNDAYKALDQRPDFHNESALLARWNHQFAFDSTLRTSYRWYRDSYGIRAHTLQAEWVQPLGVSYTLTPMLRYYTQSAASFYRGPVYDPVLGAPYPSGFDAAQPPHNISLDPRLSAFGSFTLGLKVDYRIDRLWSADAKVEVSSQRGNWCLGAGSAGLAPLNSTVLMLGVSRKF